MPPIVLSEEVGYDPETHHCDSLDLWKPLGGHLWWNSLFWTNFPPLSIFDQQDWNANPDAEVPSALRLLNSDQRLAEQYITFGSAREDLCCTREPPSAGFKLTVECMQYEGARDVKWEFPLQEYVPKRDNHQSYDLQSRRFQDNGVLHLGLNAEEFSERVMPVGELDACIHIADKSAAENPTWGYYHAVMRVGGWPYRIKRIGTFEGCGDGGHYELNIGICYWDDTLLWQLLEGDKSGEEAKNLKVGQKFWASLMDLDCLGRKQDEKKFDDPVIPPEKGYVWFTVVDTITVPSTGRKGVQIRLLEEGIVPAWMDLNYLQVFAGGVPLGCLNELESEGPPRGSVCVHRVPADPSDQQGQRKVVVKNEHSKIVFEEPMYMLVNDFVDMGFAIHDCCYQGATIKLGPKSGKWTMDVGEDEGTISYKATGAPPLCHGEGPNKVMTYEPKAAYPCERRLVM